MEALLTEVGSTRRDTRAVRETDGIESDHRGRLREPETPVQILRSQPSLEALDVALKVILQDESNDCASALRPGPVSFEIIHVLVNSIVPAFWHHVSVSSNNIERQVLSNLLKCLQSPAAYNAILLRLQTESKVYNASQDDVKQKFDAISAQSLLEITGRLLHRQVLLDIYFTLHKSSAAPRQFELLWREVVVLVTSGKIISVAAEAEKCLSCVQSAVDRSKSWISNGREYTQWLGMAIGYMIETIPAREWDVAISSVASILTKSLSLGYPDIIVSNAWASLLGGNNDSLTRCKMLLSNSTESQRGHLLYTVIRILAGQVILDRKDFMAGTSAILDALVRDDSGLTLQLQQWFTHAAPAALQFKHEMHRCVLRVLVEHSDLAQHTFDLLLSQFSDKLYIKHTPTLQQEVQTQAILILGGYLGRSNADFFSELSHSSNYLNGISNHLASSSRRIRFLGMVTATCISRKTDGVDERLDFKDEATHHEDWDWYLALTDINDRVGDIRDLSSNDHSERETKIGPKKELAEAKGTIKETKVGMEISQDLRKSGAIEVIGNESDEEDDLPVYAKPDSDLGDDDDDPELVQRQKHSAPVYIRDLLAGLRNSEDYDIHTLALKEAAILIRRKANFGTELSQHIDELAKTLLGLTDQWDLADFTGLKLRALTALVTSDPLRMGRHFSESFYGGDYSLGQRASMLSALGIGAREIAGVEASQAKDNDPDAQILQFPSKRLPPKLHEAFGSDVDSLDALCSQVESAMIRPLAANAADKLSGPDVLKVRTFSSRLEAEKRRPKPRANRLAKVMADGFFYPLTGRWHMHVNSMAGNAPQSSPMILSHLLKTLTIILNAAGPTAQGLLQVTTEFWMFLLSFRMNPLANDALVYESLLFSLLGLLDVNLENGRSLAENNGRELLETQQWANRMLETLPGGDPDSERCRMLAAGILIRCQEIVEKHQRLMLGEMMIYN